MILLEMNSLGRVDLDSYPSRPPTDPDVRISRILCAIPHKMRYVTAALMLRNESKCPIYLYFGRCGHHISEVPGC